MTKTYLAARYSRNPEMRDFRDELEDYGIEVTARWIEGNHELHKGTDEREYTFNQRCANDDIEDIEDADMFICFTEEPNDDWAYSRGGRHVELGYALACGKDVHVIGPRENVFCYLNRLTQWDTWSDFMRYYVRENYHSNLTELMGS